MGSVPWPPSLACGYNGIKPYVGQILLPSGKTRQSPILRGGLHVGGMIMGARGVTRGMSTSLVPTIPRQPIPVRFRHSHGGTGCSAWLG